MKELYLTQEKNGTKSVWDGLCNLFRVFTGEKQNNNNKTILIDLV